MDGDDAVIEPPLAERGRLLSELAAVLARLPRDRPQTWRLGEAMRLMLRAAGVAITVEYLSESRTTLCATDPVAAALENLQEVTGEGPGYEAAGSDAIVVAELDGAADQRWPMLAHAIEEKYGALSVYAIPLHADSTLSGVATLYTRGRQRLAEPEDRVAFLANAVGAALLADLVEHPENRPDSQPVSTSEGLAEDLSEGQPRSGGAWSSRSVVHQATGMVMAQVGLSAEDALALLRGHAYALGTDMNQVATEVVARRINFSNFDVEGD